MSFRIGATPSAQRELDRLPPQLQERFHFAFDLLEIDPFRPRPGLDVRPLEGQRKRWRLRVGHYRGIYEVEGDIVRFLRFGHRSTVYR